MSTGKPVPSWRDYQSGLNRRELMRERLRSIAGWSLIAVMAAGIGVAVWEALRAVVR